MPKLTYYQVLGVSRNASYEEIKNKYKGLMLKLHSDKSLTNIDLDKVQEINAAWGVLKHADKRRAYDEALRTSSDYIPEPNENELTLIKFAQQIKLLFANDCVLVKNLFPVNPKINSFFQQILFGLERSLFLEKVKDLCLKMINVISEPGMFEFMDATADMIDALFKAPNDPKEYKKILLAYADKFITEYSHYPSVKTLEENINNILESVLKIKLYDVHSELLILEAERINHMFATHPDKKKQEKIKGFTNTLLDTSIYTRNLTSELNDKKTSLDSILESEGVTFAKDALSTVKGLYFTPDEQVADQNRLLQFKIKYEKEMIATGRFSNFLKGVFTLVMMGIEAILFGSLCAAMGAIPGVLWGSVFGHPFIGACVGASFGFIGSITGLGAGYEHGKCITDFKGYSILRALFFMPQDLRPELSKKINEKAQEIICPKVSKSWFSCFNHKKEKVAEEKALSSVIVLRR